MKMQSCDKKIKISVIMGIYNCGSTLAEAIECILAQTVSDWELILCDDGSTDNTFEVAESFVKRYPTQIILIKNDVNKGLNFTLNRCLQYASGEYIARMDGDDRCSSNRFELQLQAFAEYPDVSIVSTAMEHFDETGIWGKVQHPDVVSRRDFLKGTPFCHAPAMIKKTALDYVGGYSNAKYLLRVEDYHLWVKMYKAGFVGINLPKTLYQMRDDRNAYRRRKFRYRINEAYVKCVAVKYLGLPFYGYFCALKPILVGLLPSRVYQYLHKKNLRV